MIKVRLMYVDTDRGRKELNELVKQLGQSMEIIQQSEPYAMRGSTQYKRMYIEVESKEQD